MPVPRASCKKTKALARCHDPPAKKHGTRSRAKTRLKTVGHVLRLPTSRSPFCKDLGGMAGAASFFASRSERSADDFVFLRAAFAEGSTGFSQDQAKGFASR